MRPLRPATLTAAAAWAALLYAAAAYAWLRLGPPYPTEPNEAREFLFLIAQWRGWDCKGLAQALGQLYTAVDHNLYGLAGAVVVELCGRSLVPAVLLINGPLFALALVSLYKIGERLDRPSTGLWAAAAFSLYPAVYGTFRQHLPEFAVMSVSTFVAWRFLATDDFRDRRASMLFGAALGAGLLVKYTLAGVLAGFLLSGTVLAFKPGGSRDDLRRKLLNAAAAAGTLLLVAAPAFFRPAQLRQFAVRTIWEPSQSAWYSPERLQLTVLGIVEQHLSLPFFVLFVAAGLAFLAAGPKKAGLLLWSWILLPWALYVTMKRTPEPYYMTCYLPPIALITGWGARIAADARPAAAKAVAAAALLLGLFQFYEFSFRPLLGLGGIRWLDARGLEARWYRPHPAVCGLPRLDRDYERAFDYLAAHHPAAGRVLFVEGTPTRRVSLNSAVFRSAAWQKRAPFRLTTIADFSGWIFHERWKGADVLVTAYRDKRELGDFMQQGDSFLREMDVRYPGYRDLPGAQPGGKALQPDRPHGLAQAVREELARFEPAGVIDLRSPRHDDLHVYAVRAGENRYNPDR